MVRRLYADAASWPRDDPGVGQREDAPLVDGERDGFGLRVGRPCCHRAPDAALARCDETRPTRSCRGHRRRAPDDHRDRLSSSTRVESLDSSMAESCPAYWGMAYPPTRDRHHLGTSPRPGSGRRREHAGIPGPAGCPIVGVDYRLLGAVKWSLRPPGPSPIPVPPLWCHALARDGHCRLVVCESCTRAKTHDAGKCNLIVKCESFLNVNSSQQHGMAISAGFLAIALDTAPESGAGERPGEAAKRQSQSFITARRGLGLSTATEARNSLILARQAGASMKAHNPALATNGVYRRDERGGVSVVFFRRMRSE